MACLLQICKRSALANNPWSGSSRGRENRAAGWFNDYIQDRKDPYMKSLTLVDGIKGWRDAGEE